MLRTLLCVLLQLMRMFVGCGCACSLGAYTLGAYTLGAYTLGAYTSRGADFGARHALTCPYYYYFYFYYFEGALNNDQTYEKRRLSTHSHSKVRFSAPCRCS
jgi:hypothetical protein